MSSDIAPPPLYCAKCQTQVEKANKDDIGTQFYLCQKCGFITEVKSAIEGSFSESGKRGNRGKSETDNNPQTLAHINDIENPTLTNKPVTVEAIISSTSISFVIPAQIKASLREADQDPFTVATTIEIDNPFNISLAAIPQETQNNRLIRFVRQSHPEAKVFLKEAMKHRTLYLVRVRPPVFTLDKQGDKIIDEKGYEYKSLDLYVASDQPLSFQPSTLMRIVGKPVPHPKTQKTTLLAYNVEFPEDNFSFDLEKLHKIKAFFDKKTVSERLSWILDNFEIYSHIFGRQNIATAALLLFFTPLYVQLNGDAQRGWGIGGIIGDTTTGKSETVKKMSKLLKAGSLITAETASTVGLTGTVQQLDREGWFIDWGFLPLMDRKLLAIDGSHKLNASCWAALAEAERSGVLSIAKAAKNNTYARARQIRIYNAVDQDADRYSTKSLGAFLYPVQAVTTVLDKTSIARQDLFVFSDQRDITPQTINTKVTETPDSLLENMAEILKWAWSNKAKIVWTEQALSTLLSESTKLYQTFFYEAIPLVSIDVKYKLARLSASLAYCTLSTNDDFSIVTVTEDHVKEVVSFLTNEYTNAGLEKLAKAQPFEKLTLSAVKESFLIILEKVNLSNLHEILAFIAIENKITKETLTAKFQLSDKSELRPLLGVLQNEGLIKSGRGFFATPKLLEAYRLTDGFTTIATFAMPRKEPPTPKGIGDY
jgi:hypothetical protein